MLNRFNPRRGKATKSNRSKRVTKRLRGLEPLEPRQMMAATMIKNLDGGVGDSWPAELTDRDGTNFFFSADNFTHGRELWISNGTDAGSRMVKDIFPGRGSVGANDSDPSLLTMVGQTLFFVANDGVNGRELWKSDGTEAGTVMVQNLNPAGSTTVQEMVVLGNSLIFSANNGSSWGLYSITERGALIRIDFPTSGGTRGNVFDRAPHDFGVYNGRVYFNGDDFSNSGALWSCDATSADTVRYLDAQGRPQVITGPEGMTTVGNKLFFAATVNGRHELWTSNGAPAGTKSVTPIGTFGESVVVGNELYFASFDNVNGGELWHTDGTAANTTLINIRPGALGADVGNLTNVNGTLFFTANDGVRGNELWSVSNGNAHLVRDLRPGINDPGPRTLYNANGTLYFAGNNGVDGMEVWRSDGTEAGTVMVHDINPGPGDSNPRSFAYVSGGVFFSADDLINNGTGFFTAFNYGRELWKVINVGTTDIILDFDGAEIRSGQGYLIPPINGFNGARFGGFTALPNSDGTPGNRTEQILQIVAAVREDYADYNVRVFWDDRGVNSPHYDANDTVVMLADKSYQQITGTVLNTGGTSSTADLSQSYRDTSIVYVPAHLTPTTARQRLRLLIDTISHESGHTLGLSHANQADSEFRQIVTNTTQLVNFDSRFSREVLTHDRPELGRPAYAETARLLRNLGRASRGQTDTQTGQALPSDTPELRLTNQVTRSQGNVDFTGDRDAFRFVATVTGQYLLKQISSTSLHAPTLTLWDAEGDFVQVGTAPTAANRTTELRVNLQQGRTYYLVAGSTFDRLGGYPNTDNRGAYQVEITRPTAAAPLVNRYAVAPDKGMEPRVRVYDGTRMIFDFLAYDPAFRGGVRIAMGDISGDGVPDIITVPGRGGGPEVKVFDGLTGQRLPGQIGKFLPYAREFTGGVFLASGDVNGDGRDDIITAPGAGGGPNVRVFSGVDGTRLQSFLAYDRTFYGGVNVAAGDFNADGKDDIVVGPGAGTPQEVKVFSGATNSILLHGFPYGNTYRNGFWVASGDFNNDGKDDLVTGAGGGSSTVKVFSSSGTQLASFSVYANTFTGGVRVAVADMNNDGRADIIAGPAIGRSLIEIYNGVNFSRIRGFEAFDSRFTGGVFVAGAAVGARRTSAPSANLLSQEKIVDDLFAQW